MEVEVASNNKGKGGWLFGGWDWIKSLPNMLKNKSVEIGKTTKKLAQDDPRRIMHSLKVGLALTLVSLIYYVRPFYNSYGISGLWAVMTVVVVFEFTVGATLSKGLNRGFATLIAGALGVGVQHLAVLFGEKGEPIVLGAFVFILGAAATFTRFFPRIKARYDYGLLIFILTFSMVTVSGYRVEKLIVLAHQRLSTIIIGGVVCIIVSIFVCPVWAGEDLHKLIATNLEKLAVFLEGFEREYFQSGEVSKGDRTNLQGYKSILASKTTEETLANLARWEPRHGQFQFRHPWKQYLKIGTLARQCAYHIEALNGYLLSDAQVSPEFKELIKESCTRICSETSKALKIFSSSIKSMTEPSLANLHVEKSKFAVDDMRMVIGSISFDDMDLLPLVPAASVASILIKVFDIVEELSQAVQELSSLAHFRSTMKKTVAPEKPQLLHRGIVNPTVDFGDADSVVITVFDNSSVSTEDKNHSPPGAEQKVKT